MLFPLSAENFEKKFMAKKLYDLDERLINFASDVLQITEGLPQTVAGKYIAGQLVRCGTAPCLQYAEAQGAESPADFIHKMKVALKELRETFSALRLIRLKNWYAPDFLNATVIENNELISIFVKSNETAKKNDNLTSKNQGKSVS
jgi:four helix bundle protein